MNVVVDASKCNFCMDCISPCPTGSIDNWRVVATPYSLEEQLSWMELPPQEDLGEEGGGDSAIEALDDEAAALLAEAHKGAGGAAKAPASASKPSVNLFTRAHPAIATVQGNYRLTDDAAESDIRHIILDLNSVNFPVLEGQSVGVTPPGTDANGRPHHMRLYSVSSPARRRAAQHQQPLADRQAGGAWPVFELSLRSPEGRGGGTDRPLRVDLPDAE